MGLLDRQDAGALFCRRLRRRYRVLLAYPIALAGNGLEFAARGSRISVVQRAVSSRMLRLRVARRAPAASGGSDPSSTTARHLGAELPGELRKPRRTG